MSSELEKVQLELAKLQLEQERIKLSRQQAVNSVSSGAAEVGGMAARGVSAIVLWAVKSVIAWLAIGAFLAYANHDKPGMPPNALDRAEFIFERMPDGYVLMTFALAAIAGLARWRKTPRAKM